MPTEGPAPGVSDASDLYSVPLDQFTAARDRLAEWLRSEGRGEEAAAVGKLRKPSVAAWALNRASRSNPELVERLVESHRQLRKATSMEGIQPASEARRQAVRALVDEAVGVLHADGRTVSSQTRERITSTLLAVATAPEGEAQLGEGRLIKELEPSGTGWGEMGLTPIPVDPRRGLLVAAERARTRAEVLQKQVGEAERRLEVAQEAVKEAKRRVKATRAQLQEASAEATLAEEAAKAEPPK